MPDQPTRNLTSWQVAISLVSMHYGIGMLIGTGQEIALNGAHGLLFALSAGLGLLAMLPLVNFYWREKYPLWDLFSTKYGAKSGYLTSFLSVFWMVGLIAGFIMGGSAAFKIFGLSRWVSTVLILLPIYILSLVQIKNLSKVFTGLLMLGSFFLVLVVLRHGVGQLWLTPFQVAQSIAARSPFSTVAVITNIVLITVLGMDFHQFLVRAQTPTQAKRGIVIGSLLLFGLSIVIGSAVLSGLPSLSQGGESIQVMPVLLLTTGKELIGRWGVLFMLPVLFVAIGSGSGITKIISQSIRDMVPHARWTRPSSLNVLILGIALLFSLTESSLVQLIVSFYAIYIGSVFVPFLAYIAQKKGWLRVEPTGFFAAMLGGFVCTATLFMVTIIADIHLPNVSLTLLILGCIATTLVLAKNTAHLKLRAQSQTNSRHST